MVKTPRAYLFNIMVGIDQLGNVLIGGNPDETISSRIGRAALAGKAWAVPIEKLINALFWFAERDHCRNAIEAAFIKNRVGS